MAFIYVSLDHPKYYDGFVKAVNENSSVSECYYIAGDFDFILKVVTKAGETLKDILKSVKYISDVSMTRPSVVLSTNKCDVCLLPDESSL